MQQQVITSLCISSHGISDIGRRREDNEDRFIVDDRLQLYAVVDGMGGHGHGRIAARITAEAIRVHFVKNLKTSPDTSICLPAAIRFAHTRVLDAMRRDHQLIGMGATVVGAVVDEDKLTVAHVGDCRLYRLREGFLTQLTEDHSWVAERIRAGLISQDEAKTHPMRSMVTRAVGAIDDEPEVEVNELDLEPGDRYLLCSDGLTDMVPEPMVRRHLVAEGSLEIVCRRLITASNSRGGHDNVTVVVLDVEARSGLSRVAELPRRLGASLLGRVVAAR